MLRLMQLMVLLYVTPGVLGFCDPSTGPVGQPECVKLRKYDAQQWGTCLTDTYIRTKSKGFHVCENNSTYCYYQCMIEVHFKNNGTVYPDCRCGEGIPNGRIIKTETELAWWCYSPAGDDCRWFNTCLQRRYPCTRESSRVEYAEQFCNFYTDFQYTVKKTAKQWMNAVRKCLQVSLVPYIRQWQNKTCSDIKELAFRSQSECYMNPSNSDPRICDLDPDDWSMIFWGLQGARGKSSNYMDMIMGEDTTFDKVESISSLSQLFETLKRCRSVIRKKIIDVARGTTTLLNMKINVDLLKSGSNRNPIKVATQISKAMANHMNWNENDIAWFAYPEQDIPVLKKYITKAANESIQLVTLRTDISRKVKNISVNLLLASKSTYTSEINAKNITNVAVELLNAVSVNGSLKINLGTGFNFTKMYLCGDIFCNKKLIEVVPALPSSGPTRSPSIYITVLATTIVYVLSTFC